MKEKQSIKTYIIEIIVISIGIILAFALENYRNSLQDADERDIYLMQIEKEINENAKSLDSLIMYYAEGLKTINKGRIALYNRDFSDSSMTVLQKSVFIMFSKPYFNPKDQAYHTMINSNGFRLIKNIEFKSKVSELYRSYEDSQELGEIFDRFSSSNIVEYHYSNYNMITNRPLKNDYFKDIQFGNNLMSYFILASQIQHHFKQLKTIQDELINMMETTEIN